MGELLILSRALHFGSCLVLLAVFAVGLLVERPAAGHRRAGRRLAACCLAVAAGSGFLWFWVAAAGMNGSGLGDSLNMPLFEMVLGQTPPGHVWIARAVLWTLVGVALCFPRRAWMLGVIPAIALVVSLAWLGHAEAGNGGWPLLVADSAHLLAASLWPAGLLPFGLLLRRLIKAGTLPEACRAARRFSAMSLGTVGVLAASGVVNACYLVGSFPALVTTDYGWVLIAKIALFLAAVALGACNLLVHKPRIETSPQALASMARNVWIEVALGSLIVLAVAIMGTLPPGAHP